MNTPHVGQAEIEWFLCNFTIWTAVVLTIVWPRDGKGEE